VATGRWGKLWLAGGGAEIEFDFTRHELTMTTTGGATRRMALGPRSVADFYAEYRSHLDGLGIEVASTFRAASDLAGWPAER
jgi:Family of unknown function (DUF5996)